MKRIHGAVIGLMALTMTGAAFAAGVSGSTERGASSRSSADAVMPSADISKSWKSSDLKGMQVKNRNDEDLGTISELIIDKDGKVSNVVLREGGVAGIGGNQYLIPWDRVSLNQGDKFVLLDVNKDQLSSEFSALEADKEQKSSQKRRSEERKSRE